MVHFGNISSIAVRNHCICVSYVFELVENLSIIRVSKKRDPGFLDPGIFFKDNPDIFYLNNNFNIFPDIYILKLLTRPFCEKQMEIEI